MPARLVFSTYVEMILATSIDDTSSKRILHVCGDDPIDDETKCDGAKYSPRMWR